MSTRTPRTFFATTLALLAALLTCAILVGTPVAGAHSVLVSTDPKDGAVLDSAPRQVTLTFNEDIKGQFSKVLVTPPSGTRLTPTLVQRGPVVRATLPSGLGAGTYRVVYSVVSADTHRISGELDFTVKGATGSTTTTSNSGSAPATAAPTTTPASRTTSSAWSWAGPLAFGVLLLPLIWLATKEARRRQKPRVYHDEDAPRGRR